MPIPAWVDAVASAAYDASEATHGMTPDELADTWLAIRALIEGLSIIRDSYERALADAMPSRRAVIAGHVFERNPHIARTGWANSALVSAVRDRIVRVVATDPETGEIHKTAQLVSEATIAEMGRYYSLSGGNARLTALRGIGIDPDRYCTVEDRPAKVTVIA